MANNVSFIIDSSTVFIQLWEMNDIEDWGASMSDMKFGFTKAELAKKTLHVEGSPAAVFSEQFFIAPREALLNKVGYDGLPYTTIDWDLVKEVPKDLWELLLPAA